LAVADEGELAPPDLASRLLGLGFVIATLATCGQPIGAARRRWRCRADARPSRGDLIGDDHALMHGLVPKPGTADQIADRPHAVPRRFAILAGRRWGAVDTT